MRAESSSPTGGSSATGTPAFGATIAGRYVVEGRLGEGAMGHVLAARDKVLKRTVAVKLVKPDIADSLGVNDRLLREARVMASLTHPNIVRALDCGVLDDGTPYVVMERLSGQTLRHHVRERGPLPIEEAVDDVIQACAGLAAAHAVGVVHRDIKPSNLFLVRGEDGAPLVKILDFGISKLPKASDNELSLTDTSMVLGSPNYMSPEQVRLAKGVDARTDVWALGVVLYQLLTARLPFVGDGFSAICAAVIADAPPPMQRPEGTIPAGLEAIVLRCLEKSPEWRYASVVELARALAPFASARARAVGAALRDGSATTASSRHEALGAGEQTVRASVLDATEMTRAQPRGRAAMMTGAFAALAVAGATAAVFALTRPPLPAQPPPVWVTPAPSAGPLGAAPSPMTNERPLASTPSAAPLTSVTRAGPPGDPPAVPPRGGRPPRATPRPPKPAATSAPPPVAAIASTFGGSALDDHN
jgi:eukaryotic-like serine/threonine-protein kinase